jgi:hypothetical protein
VDAIFKNLNTKKKHVFVFHVNILEEDTFYELTLNREDFVEALEKNLVIHEKKRIDSIVTKNKNN